jgi:hypothetical protein
VGKVRTVDMKRDYDEHLPLSPATLHVLLALTGGDLHGYGILLKVGLVEDAPAVEGDSSGGEPRRRYRLTRMGSSVLGAETERLAGVVVEARRGLRLVEERES